MTDPLTSQERQLLLTIARSAITQAFDCPEPEEQDLDRLPPALQECGASFVTLTIGGRLRGCIGTLQAYQPLAEDVRQHALAAAFEDFRFPPVRREEVPFLRIEISRLTPPQPLHYESPQDLLKLLRPGVDGVVMEHAGRRATFLPQVWEQIPDPVDFLDALCRKMGAPRRCWCDPGVKVSVYQVECFSEDCP